MSSQPSEVTEILHRIADGDEEGLRRLIPLVYAELRQLAARQLRNERPDHTLSPTSLVHEAFLRLTGHAPVSFESRSHFFRVAAQSMRRILVDHARRRTARKRGRQHLITLDVAIEQSLPTSSQDILGVDGALERLAVLDAVGGRFDQPTFVGDFDEPDQPSLSVTPDRAVSDHPRTRPWWHGRRVGGAAD